MMRSVEKSTSAMPDARSLGVWGVSHRMWGLGCGYWSVTVSCLTLTASGTLGLSKKECSRTAATPRFRIIPPLLLPPLVSAPPPAAAASPFRRPAAVALSLPPSSSAPPASPGLPLAPSPPSSPPGPPSGGSTRSPPARCSLRALSTWDSEQSKGKRVCGSPLMRQDWVEYQFLAQKHCTWTSIVGTK